MPDRRFSFGALGACPPVGLDLTITWVDWNPASPDKGKLLFKLDGWNLRTTQEQELSVP